MPETYLTDQAAAADDKAHREWWRADPLAEDRDRGPPYPEDEDE